MRSRIILFIAAFLVLLSLVVLILTVKRDGPSDSSAVTTLQKVLQERAEKEERERLRAEINEKVREIEQLEFQGWKENLELRQRINELQQRHEKSKAESKEREEYWRALRQGELEERPFLRVNGVPYDEIFDVAGPARRRIEAGDSHPAGLVLQR